MLCCDENETAKHAIARGIYNYVRLCRFPRLLFFTVPSLSRDFYHHFRPKDKNLRIRKLYKAFQ